MTELKGSGLTADEIEKGLKKWTNVLISMAQRHLKLRIQSEIAVAICIAACLIQLFVTKSLIVWSIILFGIQLPAAIMTFVFAVQSYRLTKRYVQKKHEFLAFLKEVNAADPFQKAVLALRKEEA